MTFMRGKRAHKAGKHCSCCNSWNPISRADEKRATEKEIEEGYKILAEDIEQKEISQQREALREIRKMEVELGMLDNDEVNEYELVSVSFNTVCNNCGCDFGAHEKDLTTIQQVLELTKTLKTAVNEDDDKDWVRFLVDAIFERLDGEQE